MKPTILIMSLMTALLGLIVTIGARRRWHYLLHPPSRLWIFKLWPYALMKGPRFDKEFFATCHFIGGIVVSLIGFAFFFYSPVSIELKRKGGRPELARVLTDT
jgi:hypothetical protein